MAMLVAPAVDHVNVLLEPEVMLAGEAVNELITGSDPDCKLTWVVAVTLPAALVAVIV